MVPHAVHAAIVETVGDRVLAALAPRARKRIGQNESLRREFFEGNGCYPIPDCDRAIAVLPKMTFFFPDADSIDPVTGEATHEFGVEVLPQHYLRKEYGDQCFYFAVNPGCQDETGANLGMVFMASVFVEFDRERGRLGFSSSPCALPGPPGRRLTTVTEPRRIAPGASCAPVDGVGCPAAGPGSRVSWLLIGSCIFLGGAVIYFFWSWNSPGAPAKPRPASVGGATVANDEDDVALIHLQDVVDSDDELVLTQAPRGAPAVGSDCSEPLPGS